MSFEPVPENVRRRDRIHRCILAAVLFAITAPTWTLGGTFVDDWLPLSYSERIHNEIMSSNFTSAATLAFSRNANNGRTVPLLAPYQYLRFLLYKDNLVLDRIQNTIVWLILLQLVFSLARRISDRRSAPLLAGLFVLLNPATSPAIYRLQTQEQLLAVALTAYLLTIHTAVRALKSEPPNITRAVGVGTAGCLFLLFSLGFKETSVSVFPAVAVLLVPNLMERNRTVRWGSAGLLTVAVVCGMFFVALFSLTPKEPGSYTASYSFHSFDQLAHAAIAWRDKLRVAFGPLMYVALLAVLVRGVVAIRRKRVQESLRWRIALLTYAVVTIGFLLPWEKDEGRLMLHGLCGLAIVIAVETCDLWHALRVRTTSRPAASRVLTMATLICGALMVIVWLAPPLDLPLSDRVVSVTIPIAIFATTAAIVVLIAARRRILSGQPLPWALRWGGRGLLGLSTAYFFVYAPPGVWNANLVDYSSTWEIPLDTKLCRYLASVTPHRGRIFVDQSYTEWTGHPSWAGTMENALRWQGRPDIIVSSIRDLDHLAPADTVVSFSLYPIYGTPTANYANAAQRPAKILKAALPMFNVDAWLPRNVALNAMGIRTDTTIPPTQPVMTDTRTWTVYPPVASDSASSNSSVLEEGDAGWSDLHWASLHDEFESLTELLIHGLDPSVATIWGDTPLHLARSRGAVDALLKAGANANAANIWGVTPLHEAALRGDAVICARMIESGADIRATGRFGETPLHLAAASRAEKVIELLSAAGADPAARDAHGRTPFHYASHILLSRVRYRNVSRAFSALQAGGGSLEAIDAQGRSPLHVAAAVSDRNAARWLLEHGADVSLQDAERAAPLHVLMRSSMWQWKSELAQLLVESGADPNVRDAAGRTPLHEAANMGPPLALEALSAERIEVNARDDEGCTPLFLAAGTGSLSMIRSLLEKNADVDQGNSEGVTPLMAAIYGKNHRAAAALIEAGASLNAATTGGRTALHFAAAAGLDRILQLLLAHGAAADVLDEDGVTPFALAVTCGQLRATRELREAGAALGGAPGELLALASTCAHEDLEEDTPEHVAQVQHRAALVQILLDWLPENEPKALLSDGLLAAAKSGHPAMLAPILDAGAVVNALDDLEKTALDYAVERGHVDAAALLLRHGATFAARVNAVPPLLVASLQRTADRLVPLLLENGLDPNAITDDGHTALHEAAAGGFADACARLIAEGADINACRKDGKTPLHRAAETRQAVCVKILLAAGADPHPIDRDGNTPLLHALAMGSADTAQYLIAAGADLEPNHANMIAAAHLAAQRGHGACVEFLLEHGMSPNPREAGARPLLFSALSSGTPELVRMLLERGADVNAVDSYGLTALHWAARDGYIDAAAALLASGANINVRAAANGRGKALTPLHVAVQDPAIVRLFIDHGAEIDARDFQNQTPLLLALVGEHVESASILLDAGADPSIGSDAGVYPIFAALKYPHLLSRLVERGVDVNVASGDGRSPLFYAVAIESPAAVALLLDARANPTAIGLNGASLIEHAVQAPEVFRVFVEHQVDLNVRNELGDTALHIAAATGDVTAATALLDAGTDVNARGRAGDTPLHDALGGTDAGMIELLLSAGAQPSLANDAGTSCLDIDISDKPEFLRLLEPFRAVAATAP